MTSPAAVIAQLAVAAPASANDITPGVLGFLVIAALAVALFFLLRSMNRHLRRVRAVRDAGLAPGSDLGAAANGAAGRAHSGAQTGGESNGATGPRIRTDTGGTGGATTG